MTRLLRKYVFGTDEDEHIIKDWRLLKTASFDDVVLNMFSEYLELSTREIAKHLGLIWSCPPAKNINANVTRKILGIVYVWMKESLGSYPEYSYLSALGLYMTAVAVPLTYLVKWALEKYGPKED